jgi:hypothetical protein
MQGWRQNRPGFIPSKNLQRTIDFYHIFAYIIAPSPTAGEQVQVCTSILPVATRLQHIFRIGTDITKLDRSSLGAQPSSSKWHIDRNRAEVDRWSSDASTTRPRTQPLPRLHCVQAACPTGVWQLSQNGLLKDYSHVAGCYRGRSFFFKFQLESACCKLLYELITCRSLLLLSDRWAILKLPSFIFQLSLLAPDALVSLNSI